MVFSIHAPYTRIYNIVENNNIESRLAIVYTNEKRKRDGYYSNKNIVYENMYENRTQYYLYLLLYRVKKKKRKICKRIKLLLVYESVTVKYTLRYDQIGSVE